MTTKPDRPEKLSKLLMLTWFFEAPEKKLKERDLRERAKEKLGIGTRDGINKNLDLLRDLGFLKVSKCDNRNKYFLPKNWQSEKYAKDLDDYFNITGMEYRKRELVYHELGHFFPIDHLLKIEYYKFQYYLDHHYKTPHTPRRKTVEISRRSHDLYRLMLFLEYKRGINEALVSMSKTLKKIRSSEDLEFCIECLEEENKTNLYPTETLKMLKVIHDKVVTLAIDKKTPKAGKGLGAFILKATSYELETRGYARVKEKKERKGSHLETTFKI